MARYAPREPQSERTQRSPRLWVGLRSTPLPPPRSSQPGSLSPGGAAGVKGGLAKPASR